MEAMGLLNSRREDSEIAARKNRPPRRLYKLTAGYAPAGDATPAAARTPAGSSDARWTYAKKGTRRRGVVAEIRQLAGRMAEGNPAWTTSDGQPGPDEASPGSQTERYLERAASEHQRPGALLRPESAGWMIELSATVCSLENPSTLQHDLGDEQWQRPAEPTGGAKLLGQGADMCGGAMSTGSGR